MATDTTGIDVETSEVSPGTMAVIELSSGENISSQTWRHRAFGPLLYPIELIRRKQGTRG